MRLANSDAGNDASNLSSRQAFDLLAQGFGPGFNGPLLLVAELPRPRPSVALPAAARGAQRHPGCRAVTPRGSRPPGRSPCMRPTPTRLRRRSPPRTWSTTCATTCCPPFEHSTGVTVLVGGFTAGSIDFSHVLSDKLPLFSRTRDPALGAAAVRHLPLAADPGPGCAHEPAQHRRGARRDRAVFQHGWFGERPRRPEGPDRAVGAGADVRRRLRPLDGLRGVPDLARPRAVGAPRRRQPRRQPKASP